MSPEIWIVITVFVLADIFFVFFVMFRKKRGFGEQEKREFHRRWTVLNGLHGKELIFEGDKLLHYFMKKKGYEGTMGEILKRNGAVFKNVNDVWAVHRLRNRLAHEIDGKVSWDEGERARTIFRRAFRDLELL